MVRAQLWPVQETLGAYIEQKAHITEQQANGQIYSDRVYAVCRSIHVNREITKSWLY